MKESYEKRFLFVFFVYVLIFIGAACFPPNGYYIFGDNLDRLSLFQTLYRSNLLIPFIANTVLLFYYIVKIVFYSSK